MKNSNDILPGEIEKRGKIHVRHGDAVMTFGGQNVLYHTVKDPVGIHARPAGALVKLLKDFKSDITFSNGDKSARADSILALMSLGAKKGTRLKIEAHGEDAGEALKALRVFLKENL